MGSVTVALLPGPVQAAPKPDTPKQGAATLEVIADNLHNPRGISVQRDGTILVAEAGLGKPGCEAGETCVGLTGSVYRVKGHRQGRVVEGLPSLAIGPENPQAPVQATGPNDVEGSGWGYRVLSGFSGSVESRAALGENAGKLGTFYKAGYGRHHRHSVLADLVEHETRLDPDWVLGRPPGREPSVLSNAWRFAKSDKGYLVTDAAANDLIGVSHRGGTTTEAIFPDKLIDAAAAPSAQERRLLSAVGGQQATAAEGEKVRVQAVPGGIVKGPDGAYYISEVAGLKPGASRIWRMEPGHRPEVFVEGLTAVTDLALDGKGSLVALTYTGGFTQDGPLPGALNKIDLDTKKVTEIPTDGKLQVSTGLAVGPRGEIYVTNNSTSAEGQLVRVRP
ncbi:ScyD/ScyE family protein [Streptomyces gossypii]|uniref:ScyD/ScyE family protein n=1 Tax=Streptomyces gossypii TaxID=2883101 RepID=UPI0021A57151|nr:ScyD/ScyE family protein [Streptomyces gossypii]